MGIFYIDGRFVPETEAVLPVSDLAVLRGYGVFDFLRTYGARPFHLEDHLARLRNSAALIGLKCPWSDRELRAIVHETLARNDYAESNIRLLVTGGDSGDSITPGQNPRLLVMVTPVKSFPEQWYQDGVTVATADLTRYIPGAKSIDYIRAILSLEKARAIDGVEALYVDDFGMVREGTTSNVFAVIDGSLVTPPAEILPGITRNVVAGVAAAEFEVKLADFSRDQLRGADEVFLTSSNKEVLPVRQIDDRVIGSGRPGPVSCRVMALFRQYTEAYGRNAA